MKSLWAVWAVLLAGWALAQGHVVQPGDTLYRIARHNHTTVATLKRLNGLSSDRLQIGQLIRVPGNAANGRVFQQGRAAWYGPGFHGRRTASGERFNTYGLTAAHRTLPLGTRLRVTNMRNGRSVVVRINDRGPYTRGFVIDMSYGAARQLRMIQTGTTVVTLEILP